MNKVVIFNVGGAFSAYGEFNGKKVMVDLGSGNDFSPTNDFLIPLARHRKFSKSPNDDTKYLIDQLFLSHLDNDHISDYIRFREYFIANFMTCPNVNPKQSWEFRVNIDLIGEIDQVKQSVLDDMNRRYIQNYKYPHLSEVNPLISTFNEIKLYYIKPSDCEKALVLKENYRNNISLVLFIQLGTKTILIPGDLSTEGMVYLIESNPSLKKELQDIGVDYLIAPHHGLSSSFSEYLFQNIQGNKSRLNIISEKVRRTDSSENRSSVDSRYFGENYSTGRNSLGRYGVRTSGGHIVIDLTTEDPLIKQYQKIEDVLREFI